MADGEATKSRRIMTNNAEVTFVSNDMLDAHEKVLERLFRHAIHLDLVVAFATWHGFFLPEESATKEQKRIANKKPPHGVPLFDWLVALAKRKSSIRLVVGLDMYHTDPDVLDELFELYRNHKSLVELYLSASPNGVTFHPKTYLFRYKDNTSSILIGSANATLAGMRQNCEISALVQCQDRGNDFAKDLDENLKKLIRLRRIVPATADLLESYRWKYELYHKYDSVAKSRSYRAIESSPKGGVPKGGPAYDRFDLLRFILEAMKADNTSNGFVAQAQGRRISRQKALAVVRDIAQLPQTPAWRSANASERGGLFLKRYDQLVVTPHYWHSGELHRHRTTVAKNAARIVEGFRDLDALVNGSANAPFKLLYDSIWLKVLDVKYAGINLMSELMHTYDNQRFAIMNGNSISGHQLADFPAQWSQDKTEVDAKTYSDFCDESLSMMGALGLKDLSELDAVLNYAYFNPWLSEV